MVRFVYVLIIFDFVSRYSASVPHVVQLIAKKYDHVMLRDVTPPSLSLNTPFEIHIYSDAHVLGVQCKNEKFKLVHFESYIRYKQIYYAPMNNLQTVATTAMNGTWRCTLYYPPYGNENTEFSIQVEIRDPGTPEIRGASNTNGKTNEQSQRDRSGPSSGIIWCIISAVATVITGTVAAVIVRGRRKTSAREADSKAGGGNGNGKNDADGKGDADSNGDADGNGNADGDNNVYVKSNGDYVYDLAHEAGGNGADDKNNINHVYESVNYSADNLVHRKSSARNKDAGADGNGDNASDHAYESVHYMPFVNPGGNTDIANRPPFPLPPEANEGKQKYVHYDTVYAERLQHMMMMDQIRRQVRK